MTIYTSEMDFTEDDMLAGHLADFVDISVEQHGDAKAFSCVLPTGHSATMTYREVGEASDAVAAYLREDLRLTPGDVLAIQCPNTLGYTAVAFGAMKAGLTITNINPLYTTEETNHQLRDSNAKVLFVIDIFGDKVKEAIQDTDVQHVFKLSVLDFFPPLTSALLGAAMKYLRKSIPPFSVEARGTLSDVLKTGRKHLARGADVSSYRQGSSSMSPAFFQYTGGTTGRSKGAELSHLNIIANVSQGHKLNKDMVEPGRHTMMLVLPLYHVYALAVGAMSSMYNGTHVVLVPAPRPLSNLRHVFEKFTITTMPGINTLYLGLMQEDWFVENPPTTMEFCYSGAAPLQPKTVEQWVELTGCAIYEGYGLTEATCAVSTMPLKDEPRRGTCGKPLPGTELRIVGSDGKDVKPGEPGELWIRGPQIMQGYLNRPDATSEAVDGEGWLKSGDIAVIDKDGWVSIVDRMKDMIIVSGFNVFPTDIEDVLTRHDGITDAAVVGVPSNDTGERVIAYVVVSDKSLSADTIKAYCREKLTGYKVPKVVELIDELPKSPVGKVLRRELRDIAVSKYGS